MAPAAKSKTIDVLIVEDHEMTRLGIRFFIEKDPGIKVIGEATNGEEGLSLCASLKPDLVLMDLQMPVLNGIEAAKIMSSMYPDVKIVMFTSYTTEREILAALSAGVSGYCLKDVNDGRLIAAIHSVAHGDIWIDASIARHLLGILTPLAKQPENTEDKSKRFSLSDRETNVLALIVNGKTNQEIASNLYVSIDTVKSHLKSIMDKLSVSDRTQAAVKAVREGLV
jgi:DNA-binding NarL/FixJ family response regulator